MIRNSGSGNNGEYTFLDVLSIIGFIINVANLDQNLSQNDKTELLHELSNKTEDIVNEINLHLQKQDQKIDAILKMLEALNDG